MDTRALTNDPITGRGHTLNTVNLSKVPNIQIATCHLSYVTGHDMPIYLHWLGLRSVRQTNYFSNDELALINIALNMTRLQLVQSADERDETDTEELAKLKLFETKVPGPSIKVLKARKYGLGCGPMREFARMFMLSLHYLSTCTDVQFDKYYCPFGAGMAFADGELKLDRKKVRTFARSLAHNCYFCASLAGCKRIFHRNPSLWSRFDGEGGIVDVERIVADYTHEIYRIIREELFVFPVRPRSMFDGDIQYHFDFGIEYSPWMNEDISFLLSAIKAKEEFTQYLLQPRPSVRYRTDPPRPTEERQEQVQEQVQQQEPLYEFPIGADGTIPADLMNVIDLSLFETGEVRPPNEATRILDEDSESENDIGTPM